jgi:ribonuclease P protein component
MLPQEFRLRRSDDLKRVRQHGRSRRHPLLILVINSNKMQTSRFAFVASRRVGTAVTRNRVKRLMRESVRLSLDQIESGWDCLIIARPSIAKASFDEVQSALSQLLSRANLLCDS